ncbi:uncharacterized protein LOC126379736 [Pectinophora gossypiella]|uniref:uncharacterized protein LOC126379736 n=1 Tax=Pectinophora gossypiella TaxID=13191 RepID=UPI00214F5287|nr:uncharacterized protein LOC126379736 [Pectinophora gossypiella]
MFAQIMRVTFYGTIFLSLFVIDYALGNGFVAMIQKIFCKFACFVKQSIRAEAKQIAQREDIKNPISIPLLLMEIILLAFTIVFLNRYKYYRGKDRIDHLLQESKETLKQTNEFLEKWRMRRVPTERTYLDEEPQEIKPLKLEVPILHMAIVDTRGTTRRQPERGDAGDAINYTDSALLSVSSLLDDDIDSFVEPIGDELDMNGELKNRYLWDVMEEDANMED